MRKYFSILFIVALLAPNYSLGQSELWLQWKRDDSSKLMEWKFFQEESSMQGELDSVLNEVNNQGYISAFWQKESERNDSILYVLHVGQLYRLSEIRRGNVPDELILKKPIPDSGFIEWNHWTMDVLGDLENRGYPFARIRLDSLERKADQIFASIDLEEGPLITWDSVQILGNTKTKPQYVQNLVRIQPGEPFSQKEFESASEILDRSSYFGLSQSPELGFQTKNARPIFYLSDRNVNVIDGVIGLLPNENEPGKVLITGQLDLELYHLGGKGRDVAVHWQRMNQESQSLDISAKESFVFRSPLSFTVGFNLLKQDSTFLNRYFSLDFGYQLSRYSSIRFFTKRQASDLISTFAYREANELPDVADFRWNLYGIGIDMNHLDSPIYPRRGTRLKSEFAVGNKRIIQNTGIPESVYQNLDLNTPQVSAKIEIEKHIFLKKSWGMWLRGNSGFMRNENLLMNDLFRVGGLKTFRGFNENFFFARSYAYINMEQRLFFGGNSYLMVFSDLGFFENPFYEIRKDYPISFGAGINLDTGNGVFRFIYGLGKSNLQPLSFSYSRIHFGYLARF
ncbi:POTRA domain-containing protein [Algoriphagus sp.]|uniref:POTRA domain-containing protein n=1 Tax=Algoriphagus sp. TaxID=1872435 RepID=UPI0025DB78E5|nr:POTRA domain-containing protein [Algoriphagus sp.]